MEIHCDSSSVKSVAYKLTWLSEEGRYTLYARRQTRLFEDAPTSDKGWKDRYFFVKREGLSDPVVTSELGIRSAYTKREDSVCSAWYWPALEEVASEQQVEQSFEEEDPLTQQIEEIFVGIPLPILEVPCLYVLEDYIRLLYDMSTDPMWASYPAVDMDKLKMKISKAELEAMKKKKKEKQAASNSGGSSQTDKDGQASSMPSSLDLLREEEEEHGDLSQMMVPPKLISTTHAMPNQTTSSNSFEEAMRLWSNEEASPSQTSNTVDANAGS
ncbi:hypothetical protein FNV43_RR19402 [Rhamnella rubrinervis]|uniref:Uncharacterized protein n=1 Tax=Rhamnella rubrinervis TaxID=2594499 RepID=A0A8K0DSW3_9ROSA|nr:hypothetical protein FNV43_RR19402 [Rhamnella rubrinervis]